MLHQIKIPLSMPLFRVFIIVFSLCLTFVQTDIVKADQKPINLLPMYGAPSVVKTADQKKNDEWFISYVTQNGVSRDSAAVTFWAMGMNALNDSDKQTAMKRFNQSWLLDPECFLAYWGFGKVTFDLATAQEALKYFDKSLTLLQSKKQRPSLKKLSPALYFDTGMAYTVAAMNDSLRASVYTKKADDSFERSFDEEPKFLEGYKIWLLNTMISKNYSKAWEIVHAARRAGVTDLPKELIKLLSEKMPDPKG